MLLIIIFKVPEVSSLFSLEGENKGGEDSMLFCVEFRWGDAGSDAEK